MSDHFDGKRFLNPIDQKEKGWTDFFKWQLNRKPTQWPVDRWVIQTKPRGADL